MTKFVILQKYWTWRQQIKEAVGRRSRENPDIVIAASEEAALTAVRAASAAGAQVCFVTGMVAYNVLYGNDLADEVRRVVPGAIIICFSGDTVRDLSAAFDGSALRTDETVEMLAEMLTGEWPQGITPELIGHVFPQVRRRGRNELVDIPYLEGGEVASA